MKLFSFPIVFEDVYSFDSNNFKESVKSVLDESKSIFSKVKNKLTDILDFDIGTLDLKNYDPEIDYNVKFEKSPKVLRDYFRNYAKTESFNDLESAMNYAKKINTTTQYFNTSEFRDKSLERKNPKLARKARWIGLEYNIEKDINSGLNYK